MNPHGLPSIGRRLNPPGLPNVDLGNGTQVRSLVPIGNVELGRSSPILTAPLLMMARLSSAVPGLMLGPRRLLQFLTASKKSVSVRPPVSPVAQPYVLMKERVAIGALLANPYLSPSPTMQRAVPLSEATSLVILPRTLFCVLQAIRLVNSRLIIPLLLVLAAPLGNSGRVGLSLHMETTPELEVPSEPETLADL